MSDLIQTMRAIIREELTRTRMPELGIVTEVFAHDSGSSPNNHQVSVRLRSGSPGNRVSVSEISSASARTACAAAGESSRRSMSKG